MAARIAQVSNMYLVCFDSSMLWELVRDCYDRTLKSMTWYNKFGIYYLFNGLSISLFSILSSCIILYEHSRLASLTLYVT